MADLPQQTTIKQYYGDGTTADFIVPFYTPVESNGAPDIDVYVTLSGATPDPAIDIKVYSTDYTYTTNADPITGGIVTFLPGKIPANDSVITIVRDVSFSLDTQFANAQNFSGANLDDALEKLLLMCQQTKTYA